MEALTVAADGRSSASPIPFWIVAIGGASLGVGNAVLCVSGVNVWRIVIVCYVGAGPTCSVIVDCTLAILHLSGLVLAGGWLWLRTRGDAGIGPVLGSLALTVGWLLGGGTVGQGGVSDVGVGGSIISSLGMLLCVLSYLSTLQRLGLRRVRLAALLAISGIAAQLLSFAMAERAQVSYTPDGREQYSFTMDDGARAVEFLQRVLAYVGFAGMALFGFALAIGAVFVSRARLRSA